ncbi:hypothetical protein [uncultured Bacteroides sp.]|uniref:hypothetical protein n=1 Tax=uncultured Bacteroides sp. TaxID=162156 RepID=UPI0025E07374|nr:hypothetical protein [uncultured Bacteroides sp.]
MKRTGSFHFVMTGLFHLQELKGVGRSYPPSGQELKAGSYAGEHDRRDCTNRQAEADKRKRTGEEQTDKNRSEKYPRKIFIVSGI